MNSHENITNAIAVIKKTHENVKKLIDFAKITAVEKTNYRLAIPKVLKSKYDYEELNWLIDDFILIFQNMKDDDCETNNSWKNAPLYVMEIFLGDGELSEIDYPSVNLIKYEFEDMNSWGKGCSSNSHWWLYDPWWCVDSFNITHKSEYSISIPKSKEVYNTYWAMKKAIFKRINLMEITSENLQDKIFGTFDYLSKIE